MCTLKENAFPSCQILQGEIHHVMNPDPYRGVFGTDAAGYAREIQDHINYGTSGNVAGFIAETFQVRLLTCSSYDSQFL